jgi:hypothetical protein
MIVILLINGKLFDLKKNIIVRTCMQYAATN